MSFNLIFDAKFHDVNFVRDLHDDMESLIDFMIHDTFWDLNTSLNHLPVNSRVLHKSKLLV